MTSRALTPHPEPLPFVWCLVANFAQLFDPKSAPSSEAAALRLPSPLLHLAFYLAMWSSTPHRPTKNPYLQWGVAVTSLASKGQESGDGNSVNNSQPCGRPTKRQPSCLKVADSQATSRSNTVVRVQAQDAKAEAAEVARRQAANHRLILRSPSPGSSNINPKEPYQVEAEPDSEYTYISHTPGYETLLKFAEWQLGANLTGHAKEDIQAMLDVHESDLAPSVAAPDQHSLIVLLPPAPIAVGSGWHLGQKQPSPDHNPPPLSKRPHTVDPNNTDTKFESNDEPAPPLTYPPGPPPPPGPAAAVQAEPLTTPLPQTLRHGAATTVLDHPLDGQTRPDPASAFTSLGGSFSPSVVNPLVNANPTHGLVHARLQATIIAWEMERETGGKGKGRNRSRGRGRDRSVVDPPAQLRTYSRAQTHVRTDTGSGIPNNASTSNARQSNNPLPTRARPGQFSRNFWSQLYRAVEDMEAKAKAAHTKLEKADTDMRLHSQI
ncbi:hypothetical protein FRC07_000415 [Ceratobasidium sp. 392]|nr:hypothetical protein FRC07_000415 [Ceratobasidium sp. 392]